MHFDTIIIGVDLTSESTAAARWVAESFAAASRVVLVHAVPAPAAARVPGRRFASEDDLGAAACRGAEERLEEMAAELPQDRVRVEARLGDPADVLAGAARDRDADLIVVGPHRQLTGWRGLLGSTAEALMLKSPVPVLLVSNPGEGPPKRVLAPVDGSSLTRDVLAIAHEVADGFGARLYALHVHDTATYAALSVLHSADGGKIKSAALAESRLWLDQYLDQAHVRASEAELLISFGEARHEILAMAQQANADLIVMSSHGSGGAIYRRVIGSVAAWVLRHARRSVLVLHGEQRNVSVEQMVEVSTA